MILKISELEDTAIEMILNETTTKKKKRQKEEIKQTTSEIWIIFSQPNTQVTRVANKLGKQQKNI